MRRLAWSFAARVPLLVVLVASLQGCAAKPAAVEVEGRPVPIDSTDARFSGYLGQIRKMIREKWAYPCVKDATTGQCEYKAATLTIQFALLHDGRVADVTVIKKAEWQV